MISLYNFNHRFKKGMLEITPDVEVEDIWKYLLPMSTEKLPDGIGFSVVRGNKLYDIIRLHEGGQRFFSQKVIDILSGFVDMSDKCYPIYIKDVDTQYYIIYNLKAYTWFNNKCSFSNEPRYYDITNASNCLYSIIGTMNIVVNEVVREALEQEGITNMALTECFGCTEDEYIQVIESREVPTKASNHSIMTKNQNTTEISKLSKSVQMLRNSTIYYSRAGGGAGSILLINTNDNLSLWIECYWEIKHKGIVIATADDDTTAVVGPIAIAAKQLEGRKIHRVELAPYTLDLELFIEDDYVLCIVCEPQPDEDDNLNNNWDFSIIDSNITYCVTCNFTVLQQQYK